ncbi:HPr family phosphocarrier protein [Kitasatospora sp. NBC_01539]|uniref:HPr family phosphocarrier protein n=1 Tax=Kitasatospora sp. NBC_01539 TaxID=2903577 RepID=UPI0038601EEE
MSELQVTVGVPNGLCARPASRFVRAAGRHTVPVGVGRPDRAAVDARSLLGVLTLGAGHGDTLVLTADGDGLAAREALDELGALLADGRDAAR